jgi:hypothetical protein
MTVTEGDTDLGEMKFLADGEHRLQAARQLGWTEIDAVVLDWASYKSAEVRGFIYLPTGRPRGKP